MELTKIQASELTEFLRESDASKVITDLDVIYKFIENNTMSGKVFDLQGEQTDDIKEVYAYMMRNRLTKLDELKKK